VVCPGVLDNRAGAQWLTVEFQFTFATAPTAGIIEIHALYSPAGNGFYSDTSITLFDHSNFLDSIYPQPITTVQHRVLTRIEIAPHQMMFVVRNLTNVAISAGWSLNVYPYNMVNQ
jgi:hypothetical protein